MDVDGVDNEFDLQCPACGALAKLQVCPLQGVQMQCSACKVEIITTCIDATGHDISDIICNKTGFVFGVFSIVYHAPHQTVCFSCGNAYSKHLSACPDLTARAFKWYFDETQKADARRNILKFLSKHFDVLKHIAPELQEVRTPATFGELKKLLHPSMLLKLNC